MITEKNIKISWDGVLYTYPMANSMWRPYGPDQDALSQEVRLSIYKFIREQLNVSYFDLCDQLKCKKIVELVTAHPRDFHANDYDVRDVIELVRRDMEPLSPNSNEKILK